MEHLRFKSPFSAFVAGPSGSGKTVLIRSLLEYKSSIFNSPPQKILWCHGQWQSAYEKPIKGSNVVYHEGFPNKEYLVKNKPNLIIIDDLMNEVASNKEMTNLFTKFSHHMRIDVMFVVQNVFHHGKEMR